MGHPMVDKPKKITQCLTQEAPMISAVGKSSEKKLPGAPKRSPGDSAKPIAQRLMSEGELLTRGYPGRRGPQNGGAQWRNQDRAQDKDLRPPYRGRYMPGAGTRFYSQGQGLQPQETRYYPRGPRRTAQPCEGASETIPFLRRPEKSSSGRISLIISQSIIM